MSSQNDPLHILIAALDWGMGHTSRCIPIISQLKKAGHQVTMAGNSRQQNVIRQEFTDIEWLPLAGYDVEFKSGHTALSMLSQVPRIWKKIRAEKAWLNQQIAARSWDVIISDNRFGFYHPSALSIFITHQLSPRSGMGRIGDSLARRTNYQLIKKFDYCWVPDFETEPSLAAGLSHPRRLPAIPVRYIGPLTRFCKEEQEFTDGSVLVLLSGPEPQRTEFELGIIEESIRCQQPITLLQAKPGGSLMLPEKYLRLIEALPHLSATVLQERLAKAEWVISRTGYSTLMDLLALGKKAILIPTPGQTEQEYLGKKIAENGWAYVVQQQDFRMDQSLRQAAGYSFQTMNRTQTTRSFDALIKAALESRRNTK